MFEFDFFSYLLCLAYRLVVTKKIYKDYMKDSIINDIHIICFPKDSKIKSAKVFVLDRDVIYYVQPCGTD